MSAKKHTHRYHKIDELWHCSLADCTHYMPKNVAGNILGKKSLCWGCGKEFPLGYESLAMEKPECFSCLHKEVEDVDSLIREKTPTGVRMIEDFMRAKGQ